VAHTNNPFFRECFIDELAHAAGKDPYQFRRPLLQGKKDLGVLDAVAKAAGWSSPAPKGIHRGIAVVDSFGSYTAAVVELSVKDGSALDVTRVIVAIDCGHVVHLDAVKAQVQGGVIWGLSSAMHEEITIENGRVVQSNFSDYPVLRLAETPPQVRVHHHAHRRLLGRCRRAADRRGDPGAVQRDLRGHRQARALAAPAASRLLVRHVSRIACNPSLPPPSRGR
jgi:isoquinoline 1-oxidoreductase beta subunit